MPPTGGLAASPEVPQPDAQKYGVPFLRRAIEDRREREAKAAAEAKRLANGVSLDKIEFSSGIVSPDGRTRLSLYWR